MSNPIETPHVILGLKGPFLNFESIRQGRGDSSISAWYKEAIKDDNIWLSTLENSDIISFSYKFNSDSSTNQALYVFKIIDPLNIFENRFFDAFNKSNGSPSVYVTFGAGNDARTWAPACKAQLVSLEHELSPEGVPTTTMLFLPHPGLGRLDTPENIEKYLKSTNKSFLKYGERLEVLKNNDIHHPSLIGGSTNPSLLRNEGVIVRNPVNIIFSLFKNMFEGATKSKVIFMLDEMKLPLKNLWNKAVASEVLQFVNSDTGVEGRKASKGALGEGEIDKISERLRIEIMEDSEDGTIDKELSVGFSVQQGIVEKAEKAAEAALKSRLRHMETYKRGLLSMGDDKRRMLESKGMEYFAPRYKDPPTTRSPFWLLSHDEFVSKLPEPEELLESHWWKTGPVILAGLKGARWGATVGSVVPYVGTTIGAVVGGLGAGTGAYFASDYVVDEVNSLAEKVIDSGGVFNTEEFKYWYENVYTPDVESTHLPDNAPRIYTSRRIAVFTLKQKLDFEGAQESFFSWMKTPGFEEAFKRDFKPIDPQDEYDKVMKGKWAETVTLDTIEIYRIFIGACERFYGELGLHFTTQWDDKNSTSQVGTTGVDPKVRGIGTAAPPIKLVEMAMRNTHMVYLKVNSASELKGKLANFLSSIDKETEFSPSFLNLSEVSLIREIIETGLVEPGTEDVSIISSFKVIQSLVNGTPLDENTIKKMEDRKIYGKIKTAYANFLNKEPKLDTTSPYSELFKNPEEESLALGDDNFLKLYGDIKFSTNEELNEHLKENNIPVFNYGFKNSNVLNFKFDLKPWYGYLLSILPQISMNGSKIPSVMDTDLGKTVLKFWLSEGAAADLTESIGEYYDTQFHPEGFGFTTSGREDFIKAAKSGFGSLIKDKNVVDYLLLNTEGQEGIMNQLLLIRDSMSEKTFTAKITTLPLFSMMSVSKILGKTALLYFMQPEIITSVGFKNRVRSTWLSGRYMMVGFDLKIEGGAVTTSFDMLKYKQG